MEVGGIAVDGLVAAHREIQGLKGKWFAPVAAAQHVQDLRMQGQGLDGRRAWVAPALADADACICPAAPEAQIHQSFLLQPHLIHQTQPLRILGAQQAEALPVQLQGPAAVLLEDSLGHQLQAVAAIDQRSVSIGSQSAVKGEP